MLSTCNSQFFKQKDALDFCLHYCGLVTKLCPTLETHWAVARQTPLSMAFSRQDWSGLPFPSPGDLPNPGIKPRSPMLQVVSCIAGRFFFFTDWATGEDLFALGPTNYEDWFACWWRQWHPHSSVLAWRVPGTGEPGGLPSIGLHRVGHDWSDLAVAAADLLVPCPALTSVGLRWNKNIHHPFLHTFIFYMPPQLCPSEGSTRLY